MFSMGPNFVWTGSSWEGDSTTTKSFSSTRPKGSLQSLMLAICQEKSVAYIVQHQENVLSMASCPSCRS